MFRKKIIMLSIVVPAVIAGSVMSATVISGSRRLLAGTPNPALVNIGALRVIIMYNNIQLDMGPGIFSELGTKVEQRLIESDFRLAELLERGYAARFLDIPVLRINIDSYLLSAERPPVFLVQTAFSANINPIGRAYSFATVDLWSRTDTIQAQSAETEMDAISSLAMKHVDLFISDFIQANGILNPLQISDVNSIPRGPNTPVSTYTGSYRQRIDNNEPNKKPKASEEQVGYVGSKSSSIFHKPDCQWVQKILPKNLITFATRQQAIDAGKKPCKFCKP